MARFPTRHPLARVFQTVLDGWTGKFYWGYFSGDWNLRSDFNHSDFLG